MNRTALLLALAVAASAGLADAQTRRVAWDSPDFGTPSVRDLISAEAAPKMPAAAPAPKRAAPAAAQTSAACPNGAALAGRAMRLTLKIQGADQPLAFDLAYDHCQLEYPRDVPPAPPYTYRAYKTSSGDVLGVYSSSDRPASTVSISLADGSSSASLLPILATADLASGKTLDLGEILLVKLTNGRDGVVIHASGSIASTPAK
jgi:hypothetical protein